MVGRANHLKVTDGRARKAQHGKRAAFEESDGAGGAGSGARATSLMRSQD
jgi:hypothetical protein